MPSSSSKALPPCKFTQHMHQRNAAGPSLAIAHLIAQTCSSSWLLKEEEEEEGEANLEGRMGRSGCLVKRVFSRSRTSKCQHERSMLLEKIKWSAIKLYLCGEEFSSVLVEDDLASCKSSEENGDRRAVQVEDGMDGDVSARERAAILIQAAFRGFLTRQQCKLHDEGNDARSLDCKTFENTSIEVQMGDSVCISSDHEASIITLQNHAQRRARSQVFKPKEEWDDSTLSSSISKLRIQNKLEATTRRERALAYAFSQQLRTCMTKRRSAKPNPTELNLGWSWLERWMATRQQEHASEFSQASSVIQRRMVIRKRSNAAVEEKESCGSNDVSVNFDASSVASQNPRNGCQPTSRRKSNSKRSASRRKITASNHSAPHSSSKMSKREHEEEEEEESETTGKQGKTKSRDAFEPPSDYQ
ncbi:protein IQ-DOMAIN 33-like [Zingiber officinale]|uniref:protein IQ-DOMAIN 33-like n=1 Tax=Zingiber officinale TaxID=94328 RepID=UPI001C4CD458|nr:protein IQ-DOMAIN 33-like [Zingiber officinale]